MVDMCCRCGVVWFRKARAVSRPFGWIAVTGCSPVKDRRLYRVYWIPIVSWSTSFLEGQLSIVVWSPWKLRYVVERKGLKEQWKGKLHKIQKTSTLGTTILKIITAVFASQIGRWDSQTRYKLEICCEQGTSTEPTSGGRAGVDWTPSL